MFRQAPGWKFVAAPKVQQTPSLRLGATRWSGSGRVPEPLIRISPKRNFASTFPFSAAFRYHPTASATSRFAVRLSASSTCEATSPRSARSFVIATFPDTVGSRRRQPLGVGAAALASTTPISAKLVNVAVLIRPSQIILPTHWPDAFPFSPQRHVNLCRNAIAGTMRSDRQVKGAPWYLQGTQPAQPLD